MAETVRHTERQQTIVLIVPPAYVEPNSPNTANPTII
jgi:hypothetical protein